MVGQQLEGREILCSVIVIMSINQCISATGNNKFDMVMKGWPCASSLCWVTRGPCVMLGRRALQDPRHPRAQSCGIPSGGGGGSGAGSPGGAAGIRTRIPQLLGEAGQQGGATPRGLIRAFQHDVTTRSQ